MRSLFTPGRASLAILTILVTTAGSAVPALASTVYTPWVARQVGDVHFTSQVVLESVSGGERTITQEMDSSGAMGWLALDTDPELRITASALGRTTTGEEVVLPLPLLSPSHAVPGGSTATLVGMRWGSGFHSHLYLASWEEAANPCTIQVRDPLGATVFGATTTSLAPRALTPFLDVVAVISGVEAPESRLEVSCQGAFSAFATVHGLGTGGEPLAETVMPLIPTPPGTAARLVSTPRRQFPGAENLVGECQASVARHCYHLPGTFFAPDKKTGNQKRAVFPVSRGDYDRVRLRMDVLYGGPNPRNPSGLQQIFWMAINSRNIDLVGFTSVRKANTALMQRAGIGTGPAAKSKVIRDVRLVKGQNYLMDYLYDAVGRVIVWNVIERSSGRLVASIVDTPNVRAVRFGDDGHMGVDVSMNGSNRDEPPSYGWVYSDLVFEIFD